MKIGSRAPNFKLADRKGVIHSIADLKGEPVVLYFYPKDNTPGCTLQAKNFDKLLSEFKKMGFHLFGISGGDERTKEKFCRKHKLRLTLLSDTDFKVSKSYKSLGEKVFMGRRYLGILRNTYVLDRNHKVETIFEKVNPESNPSELLAYLREKYPKVKKVRKKVSQQRTAKRG